MLTSLFQKKSAFILAVSLLTACGRVGTPMSPEPSDYPRTYPAETTSQINTPCCGGQEGCPNTPKKTCCEERPTQKEVQQSSCCA